MLVQELAVGVCFPWTRELTEQRWVNLDCCVLDTDVF